MSKLAKISLVVAAFLIASAYVVQIVTGGWWNLNSVLVGMGGALIVAAFLVDWRLYREFLMVRTTRHGMNMGMLILLALVAAVCVNYLANKHNKTWDLTQERLNSLSEQTTKVLGSLSKDLDIRVFYKGITQSGEQKKSQLRQLVNLYQDASGKVKLDFVNAHVEQQAALTELADQPDRDVADVVAFVKYGDKKIRLPEPFDEASLTSAIIKATRSGVSKIYFVKGHGEKDLMGDDPQGLSAFGRALEEASFKIEPLDLIEKKEIPADATVVAIIGPSMPYLDGELKWLREYADRGGRLFVALDPGQKHGLANLVKPLGVEFENNYLVSPEKAAAGQGAATVIARTFDQTADITKVFPDNARMAVVLPLASEVRPAPTQGIKTVELVKSERVYFPIADLAHPPTTRPEAKPITVAVQATGPKPTAEAKPFELVVVGDSDFVSNQAFGLGSNQEFGMNIVAQLADQKDLLSLPPKVAKGNQVLLTRYNQVLLLLIGVGVPLVLVVVALVLWFRRRGA